MLFNCFLNDFFYFIEKANAHNFAHDNTLSVFERVIPNLIGLLELKIKAAIEWFESNKMIVNPGKFPAIIVYIRKKDHKNQRIKIGNKAIQSSLSVK